MKFIKKSRTVRYCYRGALLFCLCFAQSFALAADESQSSKDVATVEAAKTDPRDLTVEQKTQFTIKKDIEKVSVANNGDKVVKKGSKVSFHIVMQLEDGKKVFDSAVDGRPWTGVIGDGSILTGVNDGLYGMTEGSKRSLWIPPHQAYGANGVSPNIPPNAKLYAEITLISIDADQP